MTYLTLLVNLDFQLKSGTCLTTTLSSVTTSIKDEIAFKKFILLFMYFNFFQSPIQSISFRSTDTPAYLSLNSSCHSALYRGWIRAMEQSFSYRPLSPHFLGQCNCKWWTVELEWHITFHRNLSLEIFNIFKRILSSDVLNF